MSDTTVKISGDARIVRAFVISNVRAPNPRRGKYLPIPLGPLPALPPIGLCVLLVNREYFKLKKDEVAATVVITLLLAGLLIFAATRPKPPVAPSRPEPVLKPQGSASSPEPTR